ncbi:flagellar basal body rod protein FlgF [Inmirania thermothiophila]|uniref:Flagellar basal-body rod protein FlgF n=1 Tax=Inmirania thermothiophila TaxID=1750597 RepID=A0A3N1Y831_9GAMM|nr:flagellar basal body rod protein FlgF [Inmirania thermothiophila]ROR34910.1 flagellar basal-body rod protein FlgF [Inmirania thermothiophila]
MDRLIYIAMNAAGQAQLAQAATAQNLANVATTGFRAALARFGTVEVVGEGGPTRAFGVILPPTAHLAPGPVTPTGRDLDVAVEGEGFIAVQAPDGSEGYTRAGDLRIDASGRLLTGAGFPVLGNGGPIALPPAQKVEIGADGTVSVVPLGQEASTLAVVDRIKLVRPDPAALVRGADGLLHRADGGAEPADAAVRLTSGSLEGSNVDLTRALVEMIELGRRFEVHVKLMREAEEMDRAAASLLRVAG